MYTMSYVNIFFLIKNQHACCAFVSPSLVVFICLFISHMFTPGRAMSDRMTSVQLWAALEQSKAH